MRSIFMAILTLGAIMILISSCATVPTGNLAAGELRLSGIHVQMTQDIRVNLPFTVKIDFFEAYGEPEIRTACFSFSGDGPYCYKITETDYESHGTIRVKIKAKNSGLFVLESYVYYIKDQKLQTTNVVSCQLHVLP